MNSIDLKKVAFFVVTGASRGIGRKMAIECSKNFKSRSRVVLLARSKEGLENTKREILAQNKSINVFTFSIDLMNSKDEEIKSILNESLGGVDTNKFELTFILHNAGTLGDVSKKSSLLSNSEEWNNYFALNVFSVTKINSHFMNLFTTNKMLVVNITTKAAITPFKSFTYYCTSRAAREMYFRVLAEEEPDIVVLNYSPGPVDTDMTKNDVFKSHDSDIVNFFKSMRENNTILTVEQTTIKFLDILKNGKFKSGDHVDYFD